MRGRGRRGVGSSAELTAARRETLGPCEHAVSGLPAGVAPFVGRERERAELGALLGDARLLTLTGAGGCGKTRLALEAAAAAEPGFADGACWVDLGGLGDPSAVAGAVAAVVGVHERPAQALVDTLVEHLRERCLLVVLDNCEHLVGACATLVGALLRACPQVRVLATSREPLAIAGEVTFALAPLPVPAVGARSASAVGAADAARLFELRARQVQPAFRLTGDNASAVAEICRRLDGIPLAIELAAARTRVLSPEQIAEGLSDRFRLLTGGPRDALPRQRRLEASVAWSYELLDAAHRLVLARLSVFAGGFGLEAAEAVAAGEGIDETSVLDLVAALAERSLVQVSERDGEARYRLLETIRLYAQQRLAERDDPARVRDRHLDFFVGLAGRARAGLAGPEPEPWLRRLAAELDDLRAAMDWAVESGRPLAVFDIAEPTFAFWMVRGLYVEMRRRLSAAADAPATDDAGRARGLTTASILALMGGDHPGGYAYADGAAALARELGDDATLARALTFRAWCALHAGAVGSAAIEADVDEAVALAEQVGDSEIHDRTRMYAGTIRMILGAFTDGRAVLEQTIAEMERGGFTYLLVPARTFLGFVLAFPGGEPEQARALAEQALEGGRRIGLTSFVSTALCVLGTADILQGDERSARTQLGEALAVAQRSGLPSDVMVARSRSAVAEYRFGGPAQARQAAETALQAAHGVGSRWEEAQGEWLLGVLALRAGDHSDAREHLQRARDAAVDPRYPSALGRALLGLAHLHHADGNLDQAWELAHDGLEVLAGAGDRLGTADALEAVAGLATGFGRPERALRLLAAAERFHAESGIGRFPLEADLAPQRRADTRALLDAEEAEACWADGVAMTVDEAVTYARRGRGERRRPQTGWGSLTPAEREVVRLVAEGCSNAEVGQRLFVSVNTVKKHLSHVYEKVQVDGRAELVAQAARRDL